MLGLSVVTLTGSLPWANLPAGVGVWTGVPTFAAPVSFTGDIASHLIPALTDTYDLGSPTKLWNQAYISQLNAVVFALETQTLFGGYTTIGHGAGTLGADIASADTTVNFGQTMTVGDFVRVRGWGSRTGRLACRS